jgi:hypothetical protein
MRALFAIMLALVTASQAVGKVTRISFEELVRQSDLIVVAKVESVIRPLIGKKYALATITEVWKGASQDTVRFLASPMGTCDISTAQEGETVVLFLNKAHKSRSYWIAHDGRGRMPISNVGGKTCVRFRSEIGFPNGVSVVDRQDFTQLVELKTLRELVQGSLRAGK